MTLLAQLIAKEEGYGIPGAVPTRDNNPGDLRHSPHSAHPDDPDGIGQIDTASDGWADLERQLSLYAARGLTVGQAIAEFAPLTENNTQSYLDYICQGLCCSPETPMTEALKIGA